MLLAFASVLSGCTVWSLEHPDPIIRWTPLPETALPPVEGTVQQSLGWGDFRCTTEASGMYLCRFDKASHSTWYSLGQIPLEDATVTPVEVSRDPSDVNAHLWPADHYPKLCGPDRILVGLDLMHHSINPPIEYRIARLEYVEEGRHLRLVLDCFERNQRTLAYLGTLHWTGFYTSFEDPGPIDSVEFVVIRRP